MIRKIKLCVLCVLGVKKIRVHLWLKNGAVVDIPQSLNDLTIGS